MGIAWCMLLIDDMILVNEIRVGLIAMNYGDWPCPSPYLDHKERRRGAKIKNLLDCHQSKHRSRKDAAFVYKRLTELVVRAGDQEVITASSVHFAERWKDHSVIIIINIIGTGAVDCHDESYI